MDLLIGLIPWWLWLLGAAVAIGAVWRLIGWQGAVLAAGGLIAVLGYGKGRADASAADRGKRDREALDHVKIRKGVDDEIDALGHADVDQRLSRWLRDDDSK